MKDILNGMTESLVTEEEESRAKETLTNQFNGIASTIFESMNEHVQQFRDVSNQLNSNVQQSLGTEVDNLKEKWMNLSSQIETLTQENEAKINAKYQEAINMIGATTTSITSDLSNYLNQTLESSLKVTNDLVNSSKTQINDSKEQIAGGLNEEVNAATGFLDRKITEMQRLQQWDKVNFFAIWRKQVLSALRSKESAAKFFIRRLPKDKKTLIFAANIEQSDRLCENSYHSKSDQTILEQFRNNEIMTMSSVAKIREGINAPCDIILRLGVDSKEKNLVQTIGRALRLDPDDPNKEATAIVLVAEGTQEERWLEASIGSFNNVKYGKLDRDE